MELLIPAHDQDGAQGVLPASEPNPARTQKEGREVAAARDPSQAWDLGVFLHPHIYGSNRSKAVVGEGDAETTVVVNKRVPVIE
jgi:hypothetical protein